MGIKNKLIATTVFVAVLSVAQTALAANIPMNMAKMQALDKVTGKMSVINVPVNGEVKFGSFSIVVRSCQATPPEETPENYAFVDVADTNREGKTFNIFKGWMVSSSPSLNSVEHPIYDVWLLQCLNKKIDPALTLSEQQLKERDNLKKLEEEDISKEAQIAIEVQEQQIKQEEEAKIQQAEQDKQQEEAQENKARQEALDDELQTSAEAAVSDAINETAEGDGPVSLLNINQQASVENVEPTDADKVELLRPQVEEPAPATEETTLQQVTEGLIILEDTHHETVEDLQLPPDIEEVMPNSGN